VTIRFPRVLVTGASGFIGQPLVAALSNAGYTVRAGTRDRRAQRVPSGAETVLMPDLAQPVDWAPLVSGIDAVIHLAGIAHAGPDITEAAYDRVNHRATADLVEAAKAAGARHFVFMSSIRAQSGPAADLPLTESNQARPTDAYGRSKLAAEDAMRASGVAYTILRPVLVYGPGAKGNLASLMRLALSPLPLPFGRFDNRRSLLGIANLIAAVRFALEDARAANETFIASDPDALGLADIISILRGAAGHGPRLVSVPPALLAAALRLLGQGESLDRLAGTLVAEPAKLMAAGWRPVIDTATGLAEMVQAASPRKSGTASRSTP
jgi:UDP-glucose 4-epimerase